MKLHSVFALALGLAILPAAAHAADPAPAAATAAPAIKVGATVWTVDGRRVGEVDSVRGASIAVICDQRMIQIPISTLTAGPRGLVSSLTRKDINHL